jgi:hypothetical protein
MEMKDKHFCARLFFFTGGAMNTRIVYNRSNFWNRALRRLLYALISVCLCFAGPGTANGENIDCPNNTDPYCGRGDPDPDDPDDLNYVYPDEPSYNSVTVTGVDSPDITGSVYGGVKFTDGSDSPAVISNNRVTISGSTVDGEVYGGYVETGGDSSPATANSNTVTVSGNSTIDDEVYGGYVETDGESSPATAVALTAAMPILIVTQARQRPIATRSQ